MAVRPYICPVIGTGTEDDPYRPKVADYPVRWAAVVAGDPTGKPKKSWALTLVGADDFSALDADNQLFTIPGADMTTLLSSLTNQQRNRVQQLLTQRGIAVTVAAYQTVGQLVEAIGKDQDPNFTLASLFVGG